MRGKNTECRCEAEMRGKNPNPPGKMGLLVWPSECGYPTQDIMHVDIHHRVLCMWISTTGYYVCGYPPQGIILPTPPTPAEYFISSSSNTSHPRSTPSSRTQPPR